MNPQSEADLQGFHHFVGEMVAGGRAATPEEILDEWRAMHPSPEEIEEDVLAVGEAIEAIENGDEGMDFEEFNRELRARYG
jgi:hypothetical protein